MDDDKLLNPPGCPDCFVCGSANPEGLGLLVYRDGTDAVATFTPRPAHQGYPNRLHGGLIGMLVDEMLVYAGAPHGVWGVTAKVRYWVRRPIPVDATLTLRSRLVQRSERGFRAVVAIHLPGEVLAAEGEGMCVMRSRSRTPDAAEERGERPT
ncbi:MAG: PaaI family thioesterase [Actinomycetota bacterium]